MFENVERPGGRIQTCIDPGYPVPVETLPTAWLASPSWLIVPVAAETGPEWAEAMPASATVALGWQGLLRVLVAGERVRRRPPARTALVERADLVGVSRHDLPPGTSVGEVVQILRPGARLILTEGRAGGAVVVHDGRGGVHEDRYEAIEAVEVDSTGAGDVFLAALLRTSSVPEHDPADGSGRVDPGDLHWAAAAAALVVEGFGLGAVPDRVTLSARLAREPGPQ